MKDDWISKTWDCDCGAMNAGWNTMCGRCKESKLNVLPPPAPPCSSHDADSQRNIEEETSTWDDFDLNNFLYNTDDR
jgi:hypothetical protein|tara:strand:- start:422 stop:652 length:231 start_codon:yes stop_codon:yes gene_type:complete